MEKPYLNETNLWVSVWKTVPVAISTSRLLAVH